jgi:small subunit ribosomal protein S16
MLVIRLARTGTKNCPSYRFILCEKKRDNYGVSLEILGFFNPKSKEMKVDVEKVKEWMTKGAQLSPTVNNLFVDKKIIDSKEKMKTRRVNTKKLMKKREDDKKKAEEAKAAAEAAQKAAQEAKIAEEAAQKAAAEAVKAPEAPVVEAVAEAPATDK